jgi:hypothetical protein
VCVTLFEDVNVNRLQDVSELLLANGTINLTQNTETLETYSTDGVSDPFCFDELEAGEYVVVSAPPDGYGLTTAQQFRLNVLPGASINVNFGAAEGVEAVQPPASVDEDADLDTEIVAEDDGNNTEQLLQISGLIVFGLAGLTLVAGLGMSLFVRKR